ncbi:hypothetical protein ASPBRDRAFT_194103 [Aspergillus brasiliensis CBS 101740]|uniref:Uncharacterized protein n=1 Tax=Aspergillus brasiliensis (strain CBS 101740 / IMI 381727 / IBT 21946) TaxID=767769 RepID=A0A1L9UN38_ASPBC|nr:hypothetical protein ASPBRDRAFT_194103 [Aspergillus brasiliensis CBS 101740]
MADENLQELRRLMKRYRIRFQLPGEPWPAQHAGSFGNIKALGDYKYESYFAGVNIWTSQEPWKQQIKARADWLHQRAKRLYSQERNEAGWRFGLENDVLLRFSAEVACPKCRARIWQSEIQATLGSNQSERRARLEQRQKERKPCQCPPSERIKDFYEAGTNSLFDSREEEFVVHDQLLRSQLPKQAPDRVIGLQSTHNFDQLLSSPVQSQLSGGGTSATVLDAIRVTPFKSQADPLLFPFMLLEAKSGNSSNSFDAIQVQSAFPIHALLNLQEGLRSRIDCSSEEETLEPLVWFLASRGDTWRVYASYIIRGADKKPASYDIALLWSGSLVHIDSALQLLLIIDYVMDWARDIYRLGILNQLKALTTGRPYDQVSLMDSEIFSMRRNVSDWIPGPPSTSFPSDEENAFEVPDVDDAPLPSLNHETLLGMHIPNSKLGLVRSALLNEFRYDCFYLTRSLVPSFLEVVGGRRQNADNKERAARHIINFIVQFDDVMVMSGASLALAESLWTGVARSDAENLDVDFYVVIECSWYFTPSWNISRHISCFAISKPAFDILKTHARFATRRTSLENLHQSERRCPRRVVEQCIQCLRLGSPWQVLLAAISGTLVTLYPLPIRRRGDFAPPVSNVGLSYTRNDHVRKFISQYLKRNLWKPRKLNAVPPRELELALGQGYTREQVLSMRQEKPPQHTDMSWKRRSYKLVQISEEEKHTHEICGRCRSSPTTNVSPVAHGYLDTRTKPIVSSYGAVLILSMSDGPEKQDCCIFALKKIDNINDDVALSVMVEDLKKSGLAYHTIKRAPEEAVESWKYNLALPYRRIWSWGRALVVDWIRELRYESLSTSTPTTADHAPRRHHDSTPVLMFLYYLSIGHEGHDAELLVSNEVGEFSSMVFRVRLQNGKSAHPDYSRHKKISLVGDEPVPCFTTWDSGTEYLRKHYPKQMERIRVLNAHRRGTVPDDSRDVAIID